MEDINKSSNLGLSSPKLASKAMESVQFKTKSSKQMKSILKDTQTPNRKSLKTIQPTDKDDGDLTRGPQPNQKAPKVQKIHPCSTPISVYEDPVAKLCKHNQETQTDSSECWCKCHELSAEDEAFQLMVSEEIGENYWKELAEQRREALTETLEENEELHKSISELKEENKRLSEMCEQAEKLADFLREVADENSDAEDNTAESNPCSKKETENTNGSNSNNEEQP